MGRARKAKGRPRERLYPPRIDATPEQVAHVVLNAGRPKGRLKPRDYYCGGCNRQVSYPEILHDDGRCEVCHEAAA